MIVDLDVAAVVFDLDGVLVDSRRAVDVAWGRWAEAHGLDSAAVLRAIPGTRTRDSVALLAPELDPDAEAAGLAASEAALADQVTAVPGAAALIARLPAGRWGIATSGTSQIARPRLMHAGLPAPHVFVTAEMVVHGKPDPEVYLRAASALGVEPAACVVFEDAPSGIAAAAAAGCTVVGVLTWAQRELLDAPYAVRDLTGIAVTSSHGRIGLRFETVT